MKEKTLFQTYFFVAVVIITSALLTFAPIQTTAQNNTFGIQDATYAYYQKCLRTMRDPSVLTMLDTLYQMSEKDGDLRMQNVVLSTRMDYYYFLKEKDSLIANVDRTKAFAKAHDLSKYYYFAWARLITYYINEHYIQTALNETKSMLNEAIAENNNLALYQSYQMMGRIYNVWDKHEESARYFQKAADVLDKSVPNNLQYLTFLYNTIAGEYIKIGEYEKSEEAVKKAYQYRVDRRDSLTAYRVFTNLYIAWNKPLQAKKYLDTMKTMGYPIQNRDVFYSTEMKYYALVGNYRKALELCDTLENYKGGIENSAQYYQIKAEYLENLGRYKEANEYYKRDREYEDSITTYKFSQELSEQAVLLNLNEIEAEKHAMELQMRTRWLIFTIIAFVITATALLVFLNQYYRIKNLNKKLKKSEEIKTIFLQNLSHEVRTPLNSIMGFSDIMCTTPGIEKKEYEDYSKIIHDNSKQLLGLFNQALEASEVQTTKEKKISNINEICKEAIEAAKKECAGGVEMIFQPCEEDTRVMIDRNSILKVVSSVLDNSAKFTKKGAITLSTRYITKNKFMISISDTGPGIPIDEQTKVFESFYKVNTLTPGSGLGLSLSRVIADSLNGSISIDSSYTDGCRTIFVFPV